MTTWILVALVGGFLCLAGFRTLVHRYRRGEVRGLYVLAVAVGLVSFACYALLSALVPAVVGGAVTLLILLPAFCAIVVLLREHERAGS